MNKLKFELLGIQTKEYTYLCKKEDYTKDYSRSSLQGLLFNDMPPMVTWHPMWVKIKGELQTISSKIPQKKYNYRYVLSDISFEEKGFKREYKREDVAEFDERDYEWVFSDSFSKISSLYTLEHDVTPETAEHVSDSDWMLETILSLDVDDLIDVSSFAFPTAEHWKADNTTLTHEDVKYPLISLIGVPAIARRNAECFLSSRDVYRILRRHIQDNINPKYAVITSDYDFCFAVEKKVALTEPIFNKKEIKKRNGKSYRNKRYKEEWRKDRRVIVFEMTYSPYCYQEYTPIEEIHASNIDELEKKVKRLCKETIKLINQPLKDCPHCDGFGVLDIE